MRLCAATVKAEESKGGGGRSKQNKLRGKQRRANAKKTNPQRFICQLTQSALKGSEAETVKYLGLGLGLGLAIRKSDADSDARVKKQIEIQ